MSWSHEQASRLIELYRAFPCLYAVKSKDYHNKHKRSLALSKVMSEIKKMKQDVTEQEVQKKFLSLRTTYATERKKYLNSLHSGMGEDEVYHPTLWYYEEMSFLNEHLQIRVSKSNFEIPENLEVDTQEESDVYSPDPDPQHEEGVEVYELGDDGVLHASSSAPESRPGSSRSATREETPSTSRCQSRSRSPILKPKKKKQSGHESDIDTLKDIAAGLGQVSENLIPKLQTSTPRTSEDIMGEFVAAQLKKIKDEGLKQDVQFEIHRILHEALRK